LQNCLKPEFVKPTLAAETTKSAKSIFHQQYRWGRRSERSTTVN